MTFDLTHARHDRAHCLAPGLFRSLKRGERKNSKLDVTYQFGNESIRFWGPEPLGADDLRVLQGLVAMSGPQGIILGPEPKTGMGQQLRLFLDPKWEAVQENAMVVKDSFRKLSRELGYEDPDGGSAFRHIRRCIERMWAVSVLVEDRNGKRRGFRILSDYESDEPEGKLYVALNPRITKAVLGDSPHVRIDMNEVRSLKLDVARLIHQRLSGWIDPGKERQVTIDTLVEYAYPGGAEGVSRPTLSKRRKAVREALSELEAVGWQAWEYARGKVLIRRPEEGGSVLPSDCS